MIFDKISIDFHADINVIDSKGRCIPDNYKNVSFIKNWYKLNLRPEYDVTIEYIIPTDKFIFTVHLEDDGRNISELVDYIISPQIYGKVPYRYLILDGRLCECKGILANTMELD